MTSIAPTRDTGDVPALDIIRDEFLSQVRLDSDTGTVTQAVPPGSTGIHIETFVFSDRQWQKDLVLNSPQVKPKCIMHLHSSSDGF